MINIFMIIFMNHRKIINLIQSVWIQSVNPRYWNTPIPSCSREKR